MLFSRLRFSALLALAASLPSLAALSPARAQTYQILHNFGGGTTDGAGPIGGLTQVGNALFGVTAAAGAGHSGTLFKLRPDAGHTYLPLYTFRGGRFDGAGPSGTMIAVGAMLYGVTSFGGTYDSGTIFSYDAAHNKYKVLYNFSGTTRSGAPDGAGPVGRLAYSNGVLYGVTSAGGSSQCFDQAGCGTVFSFALGQNPATATDTIIHVFSGRYDGAAPRAGLTLAGNVLYGTTSYGGLPDPVTGDLGCFAGLGCGSIFSVTLQPSAGYSSLYFFNGGPYDGADPTTELTLGGPGILYGTTQSGGGQSCGGDGCGTAYSLNIRAMAEGPRAAIKPVLLTCFGAGVGAFPSGPITVNRQAGAVGFGVALGGAAGSGANTGSCRSALTKVATAAPADNPPVVEGELYSFNLATGAQTVLFNFLEAYDPSTCTAATCTGIRPSGALVYMGGALYGVAYGGGANDSGTVFALQLPSG
jgi:uncharacterized repeat protein (TIGR03803 family)